MATFGVFINDPDRIRFVLEYYLGRKQPEDWQCRELRGLYAAKVNNLRASLDNKFFTGRKHRSA